MADNYVEMVHYVIGTSESGPKTFRVVTRQYIGRDPSVDLPTDVATQPRPSAVFVAETGFDQSKGNKPSTQTEADPTTPNSYVEWLDLDNET